MSDQQDNNEELRPLIIIKRKKLVHGHGHSTAWKIALADFMTTLMIVFFVMWIINMVPAEKKEIIGSFFKGEVSKNSEAGNSILPYEKNATEKTESDTMKVYHSLEPELKKIDPTLKVSLSRGRLEINLNSNILFEIGESDFNGNFDSIIKRIANVVKDKQVYIDIYGYTDNTPVKGGSNLLLSVARAKSAANGFVKYGVPDNRIGVHGEGERFPVANNDTEEGRSLNRRIILYVSPMEEAVPGSKKVKVPKDSESKKINDVNVKSKNSQASDNKGDKNVSPAKVIVKDKEFKDLITNSKSSI